MNQFYILEIQKYQNGEYGHIVHFAYDENPRKARLKAESKYHEILAAAAISELPTHAAILITAEGAPIMNNCYYHVQEEEPQEEETPQEENNGGEE